MNTHKLCFHPEIRKNIDTFWWKKSALSRAMKLKILPPKNENFQIKNSDILHFSAQNIDCGYLLELPI